MNSRFVTDKLKDWMMIAFIFTVPIFCMQNVPDTRFIQEKYFQGSAMVLASLFFGNIWLTLFFWLNMLLFIYHGGDIGASQVTNVFMIGLTFACARNFFKDRNLITFVKPLILITILSLLWTITQLFRIELVGIPVSASGQMMEGGNIQPNGLFFLPAFHGIFLTMMIPAIFFLLSGKKRWLSLLLIIPIFLTRCSGAYLALAFVIPFIIYHTKKKLVIPSIILAGVIALGFTLVDHKIDPLTYKSRLLNWHMMGRYTIINLLGWGPDSFRNYNAHKKFLFKSDEDYNPMIMERRDASTEILSYYSVDMLKLPEKFKGRIPKNINSWQEAHNEFIQFVFEYGIFGIILIGLFLKELYDRFVLSNKSKEILALFAMLMVLFISSATQFPFHVARISGILGILLGAYFAYSDKQWSTIKGED